MSAFSESSPNDSSHDALLTTDSLKIVDKKNSSARLQIAAQNNPVPQHAPGASAAVGHTIENSIPLSIFPIQPDKFCICFCGLPGRGKTHISLRLAR